MIFHIHLVPRRQFITDELSAWDKMNMKNDTDWPICIFSTLDEASDTLYDKSKLFECILRKTFGLLGTWWTVSLGQNESEKWYRLTHLYFYNIRWGPWHFICAEWTFFWPNVLFIFYRVSSGHGILTKSSVKCATMLPNQFLSHTVSW